jgi:hypothetical protein
VQVVDHGLRLDLECVHQVGERLAEEIEAGEIFEVAEVLALVDKSATGESEHILEMSADGEKWRRVKR